MDASYHALAVSERLCDALGLGPREVVALVGAGGKTSALFRLADELSLDGAGVVVTTTTKIYAPRPTPALAQIVQPNAAALLQAVQRALSERRIPVVARGMTEDAKLVGVLPEWVADLAHVPGVRYLLVEADGAAGRPLTAPRSHEPVIPAAASLVLPIVGADVLGRPLSAATVHNPREMTALTGLEEGEPVDAASVARVLLSRDGNCRGAPVDARVVPLVNKADTPQRLAAAREIAAALLEGGASSVIVATLGGAVPVVEVLGRGGYPR